MKNISTHCPSCGLHLEIPPDFDNVICRGCSTAYWVRRLGDALSLSEIWPDEEDGLLRQTEPAKLIERRLAELEELMEEAEIDIESVKSREQSAPLQMGCAFFGLFMTVIVVSALFVLLGKSYIGTWMFYAALGAAILLGLARIRGKLAGPQQRENLRQARILMEDDLAQLKSERDRMLKLKAFLASEEQIAKDPPTGLPPPT